MQVNAYPKTDWLLPEADKVVSTTMVICKEQRFFVEKREECSCMNSGWLNRPPYSTYPSLTGFTVPGSVPAPNT
jgi:hypothetical protein